MHNLEFDPQTEQSITQLAMRSGKSPDDLLRDIVISSIRSRSTKPASTDTDQAKLDPLNWDAFFNKVSELSKQRQVASELTLTRDDIYAERLR
jgi:hypothetical protein